MGGSSRSCFELSFASEAELSVSDLSPSSSAGSDGSASSELTSAGCSVAACSAGSSEAVASSLALLGHLWCCFQNCIAGARKQGSSDDCVSCTQQIGVVGHLGAVDSSKIDHFPDAELSHIDGYWY